LGVEVLGGTLVWNVERGGGGISGDYDESVDAPREVGG